MWGSIQDIISKRPSWLNAPSWMKPIARGAKDLPKGAKAKASIPGIVASIGGEYLADDEGGVRDYAGNIVKGAGLGATVGSVIPGIGTLLGAGVGALGGAVFEFFDEDTGRTVKVAAPTDYLSTLTRSTPTAAPSTEALIRQNREALYGAPPAPSANMGALAGQLNANELAALQDYWSNLQRFGANRAQALNQMFGGLSAATARQGAATERQGTQLAADIESLYSNLGADLGSIAAGSYAGPSSTAGLAPVSGAMATAPIETSAAGSNLASFLESAAGAQAQNIYDIAGAQARQGAATTQGFQDMLAMAEAQARMAQQQRAAERAFQAQLADQQARDAAAQQRFAAEREYQQALLLAQQEDRARGAGGFEEGDIARLYLADLDEAAKKDFLDRARAAGFTTWRDLDRFASMRTGMGL